MFERCLFVAFVAMIISSAGLIWKTWGYVPEWMYLLHSFGLYILGYWVALWWNLGTVGYLIVRYFRMTETGRKIKHLDPGRSPDGLFIEEINPNES